MIEEVHHHAAPAQFFKRGECFFHSSTKRALMDPGPQPHPFGSRVAPDSREVESSARTRDVRVRPWLDARLRLVIPRRDRVFGRGKRMDRKTIAGTEID